MNDMETAIAESISQKLIGDLIRPDTIKFLNTLENGYKVIGDASMTKAITETRTFSERWFSWPWRPWRKTKVKIVPDGKLVFSHEERVILMHPDLREKVLNG